MNHPALALMRKTLAAVILGAVALHAQAVTLTLDGGGSNPGCGSFMDGAYNTTGTLRFGEASTTCYQQQNFTLSTAAAPPTGRPDPRSFSTTLATTDNSTFSMSSFDASNGPRVSRTIGDPLAPGGAQFESWSQSLLVTGTRADGTTVTATLFFNNDADFQTLALPGSFSDLVSVNFYSDQAVLVNSSFNLFVGGNFSLDNINVTSNVVTAVPEPSTFALLGFPLLAMAGTAWRRKRAERRAATSLTTRSTPTAT